VEVRELRRVVRCRERSDNATGFADFCRATGSRVLVFECDAEEIAIAPDQPTLADSAKIIEGQFKIQRQDRQTLCANAGPGVCDVRDAARAHAGLSAKE
ncbi:hypothetical protein, partial [Bradyrhizobium sp.]|uniref:hypothetical protein n=1 Tax=Bradyrhizobium sp. TaxID=376 RepID=UPI003C76A32F